MGMMKKNQTKRFSYFDQKIKQKGENFMGTMNPYDISRDSRMIFKDIAYANIDYSQIKHISTETKEKLEKIRPTNLAQASRIGGVKPADISVLMVLLGK